jgi:putative endonuclease
MAEGVGLKYRAQQQGHFAEDAVASQLQKQGFTIVARNYKVFAGELDIIAKKSDLLVFVEVKYRRKPQMAIEYLISTKKQHALAVAARSFMAIYEQSADLVCRFDVAIIVEAADGHHHLTYFPNAFSIKD